MHAGLVSRTQELRNATAGAARLARTAFSFVAKSSRHDSGEVDDTERHRFVLINLNKREYYDSTFCTINRKKTIGGDYTLGPSRRLLKPSKFWLKTG